MNDPQPEAPPRTQRGVAALEALLRERTCDLRALDLAGFRLWLARHLERWRHDPVFLQRCLVRDLRRACPALQALEAERRRLLRGGADSAVAARLREIEHELSGAERAVAGLTAAWEGAAEDQRPALERKRAAFQDRLRTLTTERTAALEACPERRRLLEVEAERERLRIATGLDREEAQLDELLRQGGRRSGRSGASFEQLALTLTRALLVPGFTPSPPNPLSHEGRGGAGNAPPSPLGAIGERGGEGVCLLTGVTLGAARIEFDQLLVRAADADLPVEVLAAVEVKRNVNDLGHGFRLRQENLAWLTGDPHGYDPEAYRTRHFRRGHFDRPATHEQDGTAYRFDRSSFRHFRRDPDSGWFLDRLCFIARNGLLWGVSAATLSRIGFRVATDERWDPANEAYLGELLGWCRGQADEIEAPEVLRAYLQSGRADQVVLVEREGSAAG